MIRPNRPSSRRAWTNSSGWLRLAVPAREIGVLAVEEAVDGLDDHAEHLAVPLVDRGVREQVLLEDAAEEQLLGDALVGERAGRLGASDDAGFDGVHDPKASTSRAPRVIGEIARAAGSEFVAMPAALPATQ